MTYRHDKHKKSIYIHSPLLESIEAEAKRLDRTVSWVIQRCLIGHMPMLKKMRAQTEEASCEQSEA